MARALEAAGFRVSLALDQDQSAMKAALRRFKASLAGGDEAVFFYAGHGVELGGVNYLLPTDIRDDSDDQLQDDAIPLQRVLSDLAQQKPKFSLAIIDACRDDPFKGNGRTVGTRGLMPATAATGQMVIYSAGAGQRALDRLNDADKSPNGVFTRVFVKAMEKEGMQVHELVRNVRQEVARLASGAGREQVPALYDQAIGDFYFRRITNPTGEASDKAAPVLAPMDDLDLEGQSWGDAIRLENYEAYLRQYPKGRYASLAHAAKKKLDEPASEITASGQKAQSQAEFAAYESAMQSRTRDSLETYMSAYPTGNYRALVAAALDALPVGSAAGAAENRRAAYRPGQVFRECAECPEVVVLPSGEYEMGSRMGEGFGDERPTRRVRISGFALGRYEVTQGQWRALMGRNPSYFAKCGDDCPVEHVTWEDAKTYLQKLNEKVTGRADGPYRLPSESEWEYGCRGGKRHEHCGGDDVDRVAWFEGNSRNESHRVGGKARNAYGLHDMSGNIREWVEDCWNDDYTGAPQDGSAWTRINCSRRVVRGGGWNNIYASVRAARRQSYMPDGRDIDLGFRVARTLP